MRTISLTGKLGVCAKCMRQSFLAALLAWAFMPFAVIFDIPGLPSFAILTASGLTALWLSHVVAFAVRAARNRGEAGNSGRTDAPSAESRRGIIARFGKAAAFGFLATSVSPRFASAQVDPCKVACIGQWNTCGRGCGYIEDPVAKKNCTDGCDSGRDACIARCS